MRLKNCFGLAPVLRLLAAPTSADTFDGKSPEVTRGQCEVGLTEATQDVAFKVKGGVFW